VGYNRRTLERFAVTAAEVTQKAKAFVSPIRLAELAEQLSITKDDARDMADYLVLMGWMTNCSVGGDVIITPQGYEQIERLKRPGWQQWIDRHPVTMNLLYMTGTGIIAGIIYTIITYHLLK
jgi:hypothetical protein